MQKLIEALEKIRIKPPPVLVYNEGDQFKDRVTFLTKTFLRYPCAYRLIDSILELYPGVTVIVADDNPKEYYQEIDAVKYPTVKQYKMPLEEGFFAGRALAVSQVKTGKKSFQISNFLVTVPK